MSERKMDSLVNAVEMFLYAHDNKIEGAHREITIEALEEARNRQLEHEQYAMVVLQMLRGEANATGTQRMKDLVEDTISLLEQLFHENIEKTLAREHLVQLPTGEYMLEPDDEIDGMKIPPGASA